MYYNLLSEIKNAEQARKESLSLPYAEFDFAVAKLLAEKGFVKEAEKKTSGRKPAIEIKLKYRDGEPALTGFKIVSKPSRRFYIGYRELKPVRQSFGISVLSTPSGIMSNKEARKQKVGGEYLFEVW